MSPITCQSRKPIAHPAVTANAAAAAAVASPTAVAAAAAAYQLSYSHFYAARAALLGSMSNATVTPHLTTYFNDLHMQQITNSTQQHRQQQQHQQHNEMTNNFSATAAYLEAMQKALLNPTAQLSTQAEAIALSSNSSTTVAQITQTKPLGDRTLAPTTTAFTTTSTTANTTNNNSLPNNLFSLTTRTATTTATAATTTVVIPKQATKTITRSERHEEALSCPSQQCKQTDLSATSSDDVNFKVPSGKHRFLARSSSSDKSENGQQVSTMRTYANSCSFKRGSYIKLSNGNVRRVEDMRTEDFIQCAERSPVHQLTESTVVKINTSQPNIVSIKFSYDKSRAKAIIEVSPEYPFFVYGQGWASCNPEMSLKVYNLKCQRLQVGDICISLTQRTTNSTKVKFQDVEETVQPSIDEQLNTQHWQERIAMPENLTTNTTANQLLTNSTNLYSSTTNPQVYSLPSHVYNPYINLAMPAPGTYITSTGIPNFFLPHQILSNSTSSVVNNTSTLHMPQPTTSFMTPYLSSSNRMPIDASNTAAPLPEDESLNAARKRRWSAPENNCDEEQLAKRLHFTDTIAERNGIR